MWFVLEGDRFLEVAQFQVQYSKTNKSSISEQVMVLLKNKTIVWISGKAPADKPKCGFDNPKCLTFDEEEKSKAFIHLEEH